MKYIIIAISLLFLSLQTNAQLFGTHHYKNPTCTTIISSVGSSVQILGCVVNSNGGGKIVSMGILFGPYSPVTFYNWNSASYITPNTVELLTWYDDFSRTPGTTVFFNTFVTSVTDTIYGETMSFTVPTAITPPTLNLTTVTNIGTTTATSGGNTLVDNGATISAKGVCWIDAESGETPTTSNNKTIDGTGSANFTSSITGLTQGHRYYIRAYATNSSGTGYSERFEFTTLLSQRQPELTTNIVSNIGNTLAISGGVISFDGNATIVEKGVCWDIYQSPNILDSKTNDGSGSSPFTSSISNLKEGTLYYVRAYAKNVRYSNGIYTYVTGYGNERSFTTTTSNSIPTVSTISQSNLTHNSATFGGNVINEGSSPVTRRGVCYGLSQNPDTLSNKIVDSSSGLGTYYCNLIGLSPVTTYYGRAWSKNSFGVSYGNQISFTTNNQCELPSFLFYACAERTPSSIEASAYISSDGGCGISARGFQYTTDWTFSTILGSVSSGIGTGGYSIIINGLQCGTRYYFRPWATNAAGTFYPDNTGTNCTTSSLNLTSFSRYTSKTFNCSGTEYTYTDPIDICNAYNSGCTPLGGSGSNIKAESLTIGKKVYSQFTECNVLPGNTYYATYVFGNNFITLIHTDSNGVIDSVSTCP